jgi:hypothetical protein
VVAVLKDDGLTALIRERVILCSAEVPCRRNSMVNAGMQWLPCDVYVALVTRPDGPE